MKDGDHVSIFYYFMLSVLRIILLVFLSGSLFAQDSLWIRVHDIHTDIPIAGADVFLIGQGDSILSVSSDEGMAVFKVPSGYFRLRVRHLTYLPVSQSFKPGVRLQRIYLSPKREELQEVVVTGQGRPVLAEEAVRKVYVINQDRIEQQAAVNLSDLLANDLNFSISEDAILGSQMSLQGLSGNSIKILIDGVPVIGRLDGNVDLSQINLNNIERVEVVEGPMSIQYGTDAVAGTINLITKKEATATVTTKVNAYVESVGRFNFDGTVSAPIGKMQVDLSLGRYYFNGFSPNDSRNQQWNPKEQYFASWSLRKRVNRMMFSYRGEFFDESITNLGDPGSIDSSIVVVDTGAWKYPRSIDEHYDTRRFNNSLNADYYINPDISIKAFVAYNHYRREKSSFIKNLNDGSEILTPGSEAQDTSIFGLLSSRLFFNHNWLEKFTYQLGYDFSYEVNQGQRIENGFQDITEVAVFATGEYTPIKSLTIQPGLRYAYNSRFDAPLIKSLAVRWEPAKDWVFRASYGEGFRAPSLKELYFFFVDENHNILGNENLIAETSRNYQFNVNYLHRYDKGSVESDLGLFLNDIKDQIRLIPVIEPDDQDPRGLYTNENIDRTMTTGVSYRLTYIHGPWQLEGGVSYIGIRNDLSFSEEAAQSAEDGYYFYPQVRANLYYNFKKWKLQPSFFFNHTGERTDLTANADGDLVLNTFSSFSMADFMLRKQLYKNLTISAGVKNIFDVTNLQSDVRETNGTHTGGSGSIPLSYGRTYVLRMQFNF